MAERDLTLKFKVTDEGTIVLDKISQKITSMDKSVKGVSSSLSLIKWDSIVNLGARAIHAGEQVYDFARSIATSANEIQRQAEIMGLSTDAYQKLAYAAKMADVDNERFASGMKFLARSIEEVKAGTGDAEKYFKALGINIDALSDAELKLEPMTYRLADAFKSVEQGTGKTAIAIGLMGRSGQELVPYFNQGAEAIKDLGEEAVRLGTVLGDVVIKKGSEAEQMFKQLEARINSLKISLAPGAKGLAEMLTSVLDVDIKKSWEKMKKDFQDMFSDFEAGRFFPMKEILTKAVFEAEEGMAELKKTIDPKQFADPEGIKRAQTLMHEWLSGYRIDIDELNQAMSVLGTKSTQSLVIGIKDAENAVSSITAKFRAGKVSILDYANSIKSLTESYKKMAGEDTFGSLNDAMDTYLEKVKQLNEQYPERGQEYQKALSKAIDEWLKTKTEIEEKDPVFIRANLSKWEEDLREAKRRYDAFAASIKPVSIEGGGGGSTSRGGYGGSFDADLTNKLEKLSPWDVNVDFTATGMSPKMPLGDALKKLTDKFGGIDKLISGLEAEISFEKSNKELKKLEEMLRQVKAIYPSIWQASSGFGTSTMKIGSWINQAYAAKVNAQQEELESQIELLKKSQLLDVLKGYAGSYQGGTTYVPKTGFALVHEGEKIISKNVRYGDSNNITFHISGNDPKKIADEVAKVLKYKRSSKLNEAIHG